MEMIVLRIIHVIGAIFWVGSGIFTFSFCSLRWQPPDPRPDL